MANKVNGKNAVDGNSTLTYRRAHPGGGTLGRCSYGIPGVAGIVVFDVALFLPGTPPATLTLQGVTLAAPTARNVAGVTSAVVAAANGKVAAVAGRPILQPRKVAAVAQAVGTQAVANAAHKAQAAAALATPPSAAAVAAGMAAAALVGAGHTSKAV